MRESAESMEARLNMVPRCMVQGCKHDAAWTPYVIVPRLEGIDREPPRAEIGIALCHQHKDMISPQDFVSENVKGAIERELVKWAGRSIAIPVDWSKATVGYDPIFSIKVVED